MLRRYATEQFTSLEQVRQYLQSYPLPSLPDLRTLAEMQQYVAAIPEDTVHEFLEQQYEVFRARLDERLQLPELEDEMSSAVVRNVLDRALTELAYMAPGLLEQAQDAQESLVGAIQSLARQGAVPSDETLERVWRQLNQYFDEVELLGSITISAADRDDFLVVLLEETQETSVDYLEYIQDSAHDALQYAEDWVEIHLQESLDEWAEDIANEILLEVDPPEYMTGDKIPFHDWKSMVRWYEQLVATQQPLTEGPEFRTKSRRTGPRVVDVTQLQEG